MANNTKQNETVEVVNPVVELTPEQIAAQAEANAKAEAQWFAEVQRKEQMDNLKAAVKAEETIVLVELFESHQTAIEILGIERKTVQTMAESAFASVLRGKVDAAIRKLKGEAFDAHRRKNTTIAEALAVEILGLEQLKSTI